jgi:uncharacterized phage protein gp47/JayE
MYNDSKTWAHDSIGVTTAEKSWYLAEGATAGSFDTWVLVMNPGEERAHVRLTFLTDSGPVPGPEYDLDPGKRHSFHLDEHVTSYDVSTLVSSDKPICAERAMYNDSKTWAHDSVGYPGK